MTDDQLDALLEDYRERAAIIEADGASRATSERRAWRQLVAREGPEVMRQVRERAFNRGFEQARGRALGRGGA